LKWRESWMTANSSFLKVSESWLLFSIGRHINQSSDRNTDTGFHIFLHEYAHWKGSEFFDRLIEKLFFQSIWQVGWVGSFEFTRILQYHYFPQMHTFTLMRILFSALIERVPGIQCYSSRWQNSFYLVFETSGGGNWSQHGFTKWWPHERRISDRRLICGRSWFVLCLALSHQKYLWGLTWFTRKIDGCRQDCGTKTFLPFSPLSKSISAKWHLGRSFDFHHWDETFCMIHVPGISSLLWVTNIICAKFSLSRFFNWVCKHFLRRINSRLKMKAFIQFWTNCFSDSSANFDSPSFLSKGKLICLA
jgi:hypothetical protein